jgi:hypothetical protein
LKNPFGLGKGLGFLDKTSAEENLSYMTGSSTAKNSHAWKKLAV